MVGFPEWVPRVQSYLCLDPSSLCHMSEGALGGIDLAVSMETSDALQYETLVKHYEKWWFVTFREAAP